MCLLVLKVEFFLQVGMDDRGSSLDKVAIVTLSSGGVYGSVSRLDEVMMVTSD